MELSIYYKKYPMAKKLYGVLYGLGTTYTIDPTYAKVVVIVLYPFS
jgi:phage shock protein PspC (stress-responsive transcriptional regulator)